jgi:hypothetical protein
MNAPGKNVARFSILAFANMGGCQIEPGPSRPKSEGAMFFTGRRSAGK